MGHNNVVNVVCGRYLKHRSLLLLMGSSPSKKASQTKQQQPKADKRSNQSTSRVQRRTEAQLSGAAASERNRSSNMAPSSSRHSGRQEDSSVEARLPNEEYVFETFHHNNGRSYVCLYNQGKRLFLDSWASQEWCQFPAQWYSQGHLVRDGGDRAAEYAGITTDDIDLSDGFRVTTRTNDREGIFHHPVRGKLSTYFVEEQRNVLYFYDEKICMWVKVPAAWEAEAHFLKPMIKNLKEAIPEWKDDIDIVASLRQSSYDPDDAMSTLITVGIDDPVVLAKSKGVKADQSKALKEQAAKIATLEAKIKDQTEEIALLKKDNDRWKSQCEELTGTLKKFHETITHLEVQNKTSVFHVEGLKREQTMMLQRERTMLKAAPQPLPVPIPEGPVLDKETVDNIQKMSKGMKKLDQQHLELKEFVMKQLAELGRMSASAYDGFKNLKGEESGLVKEIQEVRALYRKEMLTRKMLYNQLQELRGNIRVFLRCKPDKEVKIEVSADTVTVLNAQGRKQTFEFDKVYEGNAKQESIFEDTKPIITSCIDGYNVCLLAYGQTGSGKTYTMMGPDNNPGVNIRAIKELLTLATEKERISYTFSVSIFEVYNETVRDLISNDKDQQNLNVRVLGKNVEVEGATEIDIKTVDDVKKIISTADKNRKVAQTNMNTNSSRSHLLLKLKVEGHDTVTGQVSFGTLTLVDLAGSEKVAKSGATGQTLVEAAAINKSLSSLGQVYMALKEKSMHIPYRNSKLTQLLQPSLGGDAKACMFINVSTLESNMPETLSTLLFGASARQVELGKASQHTMPAKKPPILPIQK